MRSLLALMIGSMLALGCARQAGVGTTATRARAKTPQARDHFALALAQMKRGAYESAVEGFDGLVAVYPESGYVSASLYNAGLCLQRLERWSEATTRYERLLDMRPGSRDTKHTRFQLAFLYIETERFEEAFEVADLLIGHTGLSSDERSEVMARRAEALLGQGKLDAAAEAAQEALRFSRTRSRETRIRDPFFVASASYTFAETLRLRSERIQILVAEVGAQRVVLERRAALLLDAQRAYFDTIRLTEPYWASAAGYRIGAMYDAFWFAITNAPIPPPTFEMSETELALYRREYRQRIAELAQPLVQHAIRYWELTLSMVGRTGVRSEWTDRIRRGLERARMRLRTFAQRGSRVREESG